MTNATTPWSTTTEALAQLTWGYFPERQDEIRATFEAMANMGIDPDSAIAKAGECLAPVHENYSARTNAELLKRFPEVQKALFGLELDPVKGRRYREHFLHMFNVWVLGGRILGGLLPAEDTYGFMKVQPEPNLGLFPDPYDRETRLWFIWALMATFHDVGIPVQHIDEVHRGLNTYLDFFEVDLPPFVLQDEPASAVSLEYYFSLMSRMFASGVAWDAEREGYYKWADRGDSYFWRALIEGFSHRDHGIVAAIRLFRSVEVMFMRDLHPDPRYHLKTLPDWNTYVQGILEQDINRAAVAIALHSISDESYPRLFPIPFAKYPLTFLLMLCDELQEFFRLEGITLKGVIPLQRLPVVNASFIDDAKRVNIQFIAYYEEPAAEEDANAIVYNAQMYAQSKKDPYEHLKTFRDVISDRWGKTTKTLCERLLLAKAEPVRIEIAVHFKPRVGGVQGLHTFDSDTDCGN